jgi:hypothetical protein
VVNLVQSVLNNSLSTRLNKSTPTQVFTGHAETTPFALMFMDNVPVNVPLDFIKAHRLVEVKKLSKTITELACGLGSAVSYALLRMRPLTISCAERFHPNICPTIFYYVRALDRCYQYAAL